MNRSILTFALAALVGFSLSAESAPVRISARYDAAGLISFAFPLSAEYALTDSITLTADLAFSPNAYWTSNISYLNFIAGGRYYFGTLVAGLLPAAFSPFVAGPAPKGLFGGAKLGFITEAWNWGSGYKGSYMAGGLGIELGDKYFFSGSSGLYVEGVLGYIFYFPGSWKWTRNGQTYVWPSEPAAGFVPSRFTYGASLGWAF